MKKLFHLSALLLLSTLNSMPRRSETAAGQPSNKAKSMKNKQIITTVALLTCLSTLNTLVSGSRFKTETKGFPSDNVHFVKIQHAAKETYA